MLEEKIDKLIASIEALTAAVSGTNLTINEEQPASKEEPAEKCHTRPTSRPVFENGKKRSQKQGENHQKSLPIRRGIAKRY